MSSLVDSIRASLSAARLGTYETAAALHDPSAPEPLAAELYIWNAQMSSALLTPLHICEIVVRNAVSEALEANFGARWPWSRALENFLPTSGRTNFKQVLIKARHNQPSTGKVIAELKFVFWQKQFVSAQDQRLWNPYLRQVFPNLDPAISVADHRLRIHDDLEVVRALRNRIAHHEPIFARNLGHEYQLIRRLIEGRCIATADWMDSHQQATALIARNPLSMISPVSAS